MFGLIGVLWVVGGDLKECWLQVLMLGTSSVWYLGGHKPGETETTENVVEAEAAGCNPPITVNVGNSNRSIKQRWRY